MDHSYRVRLTPESIADLDAIHAYFSQDSQDVASKIIEKLLSNIDSLKQFPHRTIYLRKDRRMSRLVRTLPVPPYVIYIRVTDESAIVEILTIRHGARRRPRRFP
jgi:plasmid stabilization system protein ParE